MRTKARDIPDLAERVLRYLLYERALGRGGPDQPITAPKLIEHAAKYQVKISDTALREIMNYLRKHKRPVGSTTKGYFGIVHSSEFDGAIQHLVTRARDLEEQIREMKEAQQDMFKIENSLMKNPVAKQLVEQLQLVPA